MKNLLILIILISLMIFSNCAKPQNGLQESSGPQGVAGAQGASGVTGAQGLTTGLSITSIIHPCPDDTSPFREVFLLLSDGELLWDFSDNLSGADTRFALAIDGTFEDSDGSGCIFTISTVGNVMTISSDGFSQSWTVTQ